MVWIQKERSFFRQSAVPEVHELAWYLSTVTPMGLLERCHSYKDKVARGISPSHGLFAYPVLMAADILLYDADRVPVGQDQKQHLEVARDIAGKFNDKYGQVFKLPESIIREDAGVVPGVDGQKMSKSYGNTLEIFAPEKDLRKKIMAIKTDSTPVEAPKAVEGSTLWGLVRLMGTDAERAEYRAKMEKGGTGYGDLKKGLADLVLREFEGMRKKREELASDSPRVEQWMNEGAAKARKNGGAGSISGSNCCGNAKMIPMLETPGVRPCVSSYPLLRDRWICSSTLLKSRRWIFMRFVWRS